MVNYDIDDNNVNGNDDYQWIADNALQWLITVWMTTMLMAMMITIGYLTMVNYEAMTIMLMAMMVTNG